MLRRHPFYCEENVWHLCRDGHLGRRMSGVVVISNPARAFLMWHQRAGRGDEGLLRWDYHVIAIADGPSEVWDLDTVLGTPIAAREYFRQSFRPGIAPRLQPRFRLVDAETFVQRFVSDRAHMRRRDGSYEQPPPPWDPIGAPGAPSNLARFVDVSAPFLGELLDLEGMLARYG